MHAYDLKWCITTWQSGKIKISYETKNSARKYFLASPYKVKDSRTIKLSQKELDFGMIC